MALAQLTVVLQRHLVLAVVVITELVNQELL
jgi:hypothetical protein